MFNYVEEKVSRFLSNNNYQCSRILTTDLFIWLAFGLFYSIHLIIKFITYFMDKESSLKSKNKKLYYTLITFEIIIFLILILIISYLVFQYFIKY